MSPFESQEARPLLSIRNLSVAFETEGGRVEAVRGVSLDLQPGRVLALVGESGSGKSVTAFSILRLVQKPGRITGGSILFQPEADESIDLAGLKDDDERLFAIRGNRISMIFQEPMTALSPVHSIGNQLMEAVRLHQPVDKAEARRRAADMLDKVGINDPERRLDQFPHEFSGGMRQRVVIAMALICRPDLLIADEPTTALDVTIQAQILALIKRLQGDTGAGVLFITHDMGVVAQIADDVAVMYRGRIVEKGTVRQILKDPRHPYTRGLLDAIPGRVTGQTRLKTVADAIEGRDLSQDWPLVPLPDGRHVALPPETQSTGS